MHVSPSIPLISLQQMIHINSGVLINLKLVFFLGVKQKWQGQKLKLEIRAQNLVFPSTSIN